MEARIVTPFKSLEDLHFSTLVNSARVNRVGTAVSLRLDYPVARVEDWAVVLAKLARQQMMEVQAEAAEPAPADAGESTDGEPGAGA